MPPICSKNPASCSRLQTGHSPLMGVLHAVANGIHRSLQRLQVVPTAIPRRHVPCAVSKESGENLGLHLGATRGTSKSVSCRVQFDDALAKWGREGRGGGKAA